MKITNLADIQLSEDTMCMVVDNTLVVPTYSSFYFRFMVYNNISTTLPNNLSKFFISSYLYIFAIPLSSDLPGKI